MLHFTAPRRVRDCEGRTRRDFLRVGGAGLLGLPALLAGRAAAKDAGRPVKETSVIWLWLGGGPSQIETFDPKMTATAEFRSVTGEVKTSLPGVTFGGTFPKLAKLAHRMSVVRSFAHANSSHGGATHWVNTGFNFFGFDGTEKPQQQPAIGAIAAHTRGLNHAKTGMPTYVKLGGRNRADGPAYLGKACSPFDLTGEGLSDLTPKAPAGQLDTRRGLMAAFDRTRRDVDASGSMDSIDHFERQALGLITGKAAEAFDLSKESPRTVAKYATEPHPRDKVNLGECLLLARRLCEAGCGVVNVAFNGWDHHNVNGTLPVKEGFEQLGPSVDHAVSTFIEDTHDRGLQDRILLVITGEFGRTPRISTGKQAGGRDHWGPLSTLALIGGGLKMGQVVGESSPRAEVPATQPIGPLDLFATMFHVLGIDGSMPDSAMLNGRPIFPEKYTGKPIPELI